MKTNFFLLLKLILLLIVVIECVPRHRGRGRGYDDYDRYGERGYRRGGRGWDSEDYDQDYDGYERRPPRRGLSNYASIGADDLVKPQGKYDKKKQIAGRARGGKPADVLDEPILEAQDDEEDEDSDREEEVSNSGEAQGESMGSFEANIKGQGHFQGALRYIQDKIDRAKEQLRKLQETASSLELKIDSGMSLNVQANAKRTRNKGIKSYSGLSSYDDYDDYRGRHRGGRGYDDYDDEYDDYDRRRHRPRRKPSFYSSAGDDSIVKPQNTKYDPSKQIAGRSRARTGKPAPELENPEKESPPESDNQDSRNDKSNKKQDDRNQDRIHGILGYIRKKIDHTLQWLNILERKKVVLKKTGQKSNKQGRSQGSPKKGIKSFSTIEKDGAYEGIVAPVVGFNDAIKGNIDASNRKAKRTGNTGYHRILQNFGIPDITLKKDKTNKKTKKRSRN